MNFKDRTGLISLKVFEEMLSILAEINPKPKSDLNYKNSFTFAVAVILSAQSTDKRVNIVGEVLFEKVKSAQDIVDMGLENFREEIKTIGLFNNKAKAILNMSQELLEKYDGQLPKTVDELESLSGIGRKSANVIANELYGANTVGVDTHVLRLVHRLKILPEFVGKDPKKVEAGLMEITPEKYLSRVSNYLVLHGRYICKAKNPDCVHCPIYELCEFEGRK